MNKKIFYIKKQYMVPVYNRNVIEDIPDEDIQFVINDQLFLDVILMELRGQSISYACYKSKQRNNREKELIKNIGEIEGCVNENNIDRLETLKTELFEIRQEKLKGHIIRSKAQYIDKGEKPTKFFCGLEKHNYVSKSMHKLEMADGKILNNQFEMNKLTDNQSNSLDGMLTLPEISATLKSMKNEKSPGLSGFSAEFFKVFWKQLGAFVLWSLNYGYKNGELSITQKQGLLTCIPKENKPKHLLKNWRPLTLLDTVYKIASGSIANRLKTVLDDIIHKDKQVS